MATSSMMIFASALGSERKTFPYSGSSQKAAQSPLPSPTTSLPRTLRALSRKKQVAVCLQIRTPPHAAPCIGIWVGLDGCVEALDQLAASLSSGELTVEQAQAKANELAVDEKDEKSAEIYKRIFSKVLPIFSIRSFDHQPPCRLRKRVPSSLQARLSA